MKRTNRFSLIALAAALLLAAVALPSVWADVGGSAPAQGTLDQQREHLWQMRTIMHSATFAAESTATGVTVRVTSPDATLAGTIREEFTERHEPASPLAGSAVSVSETPDGVALAFSSDDPAVVTQLQAAGAGLGYAMLRNEMHAAMVGLQGAGGFGPGMMGGGMMGGGWQGSGPQGYGRGMMGGGYGHGPGMMGGWQGYGPQAPTNNQ